MTKRVSDAVQCLAGYHDVHARNMRMFCHSINAAPKQASSIARMRRAVRARWFQVVIGPTYPLPAPEAR